MELVKWAPVRRRPRPHLPSAATLLHDFSLSCDTTKTKQITAFVALLTMDANRQKAGRMDWCCCFKSNKFLEEVCVIHVVAVCCRLSFKCHNHACPKELRISRSGGVNVDHQARAGLQKPSGRPTYYPTGTPCLLSIFV